MAEDAFEIEPLSPCVGGAGSEERNMLLLKGTVSYQLDPALRMLGNLNLSRSSSSQGAFYDGDYTEVVLGRGSLLAARDAIGRR